MSTRVNSRQAKRDKFVAKAKRTEKTPARLSLTAVIGLLVVVVIGGGALWALNRPKAAAGAATPILDVAEVAAAPVQASAGDAATPIQAAAAVAATHGHEPYPQVLAVDGVIRLAASTFADGKASHYTYMNGSQPIEFFVLRSSDGVIRAAFNACDVCFAAKQGYVQEGDNMVCMNCGRRFPSNQINVVQGGCNPAPLDRTMAGDMVVIRVEDLLQGGRYF